MINDPAVVVLVAEDDFNSIENQPRLQSLQQATLRRPTATPQGKVIVGVCSIILKPGSSLIGQLKNGHAGGKHAGSFNKPPSAVTDHS